MISDQAFPAAHRHSATACHISYSFLLLNPAVSTQRLHNFGHYSYSL